MGSNPVNKLACALPTLKSWCAILALKNLCSGVHHEQYSGLCKVLEMKYVFWIFTRIYSVVHSGHWLCIHLCHCSDAGIWQVNDQEFIHVSGY